MVIESGESRLSCTATVCAPLPKALFTVSVATPPVEKLSERVPAIV